MFDNIGGKIKTLAVITCVLGMVASVISGFIMIEVGGIWIIIGGCLVSWIASFFTYGFGELIEQSSIAAANTTEIRSALRSLQPAPVAKTPKPTVAQNYATAAKPIPRTESSHAAPVGTVTPIHDRTTGEIICPNCNTRQKGDRWVCWSCGQQFKE